MRFAFCSIFADLDSSLRYVTRGGLRLEWSDVEEVEWASLMGGPVWYARALSLRVATRKWMSREGIGANFQSQQLTTGTDAARIEISGSVK